MSNEGYKEFIEKIVKNKINVFGYIATKKANNVKGLTVDNTGNVVTFSDDPKQILQDLLDEFELIGGEISTIGAKTAVVELRQKYPSLELPEKLTK